MIGKNDKNVTSKTYNSLSSFGKSLIIENNEKNNEIKIGKMHLIYNDIEEFRLNFPLIYNFENKCLEYLSKLSNYHNVILNGMIDEFILFYGKYYNFDIINIFNIIYDCTYIPFQIIKNSNNTKDDIKNNLNIFFEKKQNKIKNFYDFILISSDFLTIDYKKNFKKISQKIYEYFKKIKNNVLKGIDVINDVEETKFYKEKKNAINKIHSINDDSNIVGNISDISEKIKENKKNKINYLGLDNYDNYFSNEISDIIKNTELLNDYIGNNLNELISYLLNKDNDIRNEILNIFKNININIENYNIIHDTPNDTNYDTFEYLFNENKKINEIINIFLKKIKMHEFSNENEYNLNKLVFKKLLILKLTVILLCIRISNINNSDININNTKLFKIIHSDLVKQTFSQNYKDNFNNCYIENEHEYNLSKCYLDGCDIFHDVESISLYSNKLKDIVHDDNHNNSNFNNLLDSLCNQANIKKIRHEYIDNFIKKIIVKNCNSIGFSIISNEINFMSDEEAYVILFDNIYEINLTINKKSNKMLLKKNSATTTLSLKTFDKINKFFYKESGKNINIELLTNFYNKLNSVKQSEFKKKCMENKNSIAESLFEKCFNSNINFKNHEEIEENYDVHIEMNPISLLDACGKEYSNYNDDDINYEIFKNVYGKYDYHVISYFIDEDNIHVIFIFDNSASSTPYTSYILKNNIQITSSNSLKKNNLNEYTQYNLNPNNLLATFCIKGSIPINFLISKSNEIGLTNNLKLPRTGTGSKASFIDFKDKYFNNIKNKISSDFINKINNNGYWFKNNINNGEKQLLLFGNKTIGDLIFSKYENLYCLSTIDSLVADSVLYNFLSGNSEHLASVWRRKGTWKYTPGLYSRNPEIITKNILVQIICVLSYTNFYIKFNKNDDNNNINENDNNNNELKIIKNINEYILNNIIGNKFEEYTNNKIYINNEIKINRITNMLMYIYYIYNNNLNFNNDTLKNSNQSSNKSMHSSELVKNDEYMMNIDNDVLSINFENIYEDIYYNLFLREIEYKINNDIEEYKNNLIKCFEENYENRISFFKSLSELKRINNILYINSVAFYHSNKCDYILSNITSKAIKDYVLNEEEQKNNESFREFKKYYETILSILNSNPGRCDKSSLNILKFSTEDKIIKNTVVKYCFQTSKKNKINYIVKDKLLKIFDLEINIPINKLLKNANNEYNDKKYVAKLYVNENFVKLGKSNDENVACIMNSYDYEYYDENRLKPPIEPKFYVEDTSGNIYINNNNSILKLTNDLISLNEPIYDKNNDDKLFNLPYESELFEEKNPNDFYGNNYIKLIEKSLNSNKIELLIYRKQHYRLNFINKLKDECEHSRTLNNLETLDYPSFGCNLYESVKNNLKFIISYKNKQNERETRGGTIYVYLLTIPNTLGNLLELLEHEFIVLQNKNLYLVLVKIIIQVREEFSKFIYDENKLNKTISELFFNNEELKKLIIHLFKNNFPSTSEITNIDDINNFTNHVENIYITQNEYNYEYVGNVDDQNEDSNLKYFERYEKYAIEECNRKKNEIKMPIVRTPTIKTKKYIKINNNHI